MRFVTVLRVVARSASFRCPFQWLRNVLMGQGVFATASPLCETYRENATNLVISVCSAQASSSTYQPSQEHDDE